jgi:hypothetical protein
MERFIIIHAVKSGATQDELWERSHTVATSAVRGATWLRSYFLPDSDELICDWEAPDEAAIRESLEAAGAERFIPVKHIYSAVYVDPEYFK